MVGARLLTATLLAACVGCESTPVCSQTSTPVDVPLGARLLDGSEGALLWSTASELFLSRSDENQPTLLLADAGIDRAVIANK